eukprot:jgi/Bigna1/74967/fgenesh1_pg.32_\
MAASQMEIVFYDVETTIPFKKGQGYAMLEFGAVVVDKIGLYEKECFSTLIKPTTGSNEFMENSAPITKRSIDCNGITDRIVQNAPSFKEVADQIFRIMDGRVWAGHNIIRFDNRRIVEEFKKIGRDPPKPKALIDTLPLLRRTFGSERAGNLKMATLGHHFGLGAERHRALEDTRMNIEVLQRCATVLFLEQHAELSIQNSKMSPQTHSRLIFSLRAAMQESAEDEKKALSEKEIVPGSLPEAMRDLRLKEKEEDGEGKKKKKEKAGGLEGGEEDGAKGKQKEPPAGDKAEESPFRRPLQEAMESKSGIEKCYRIDRVKDVVLQTYSSGEGQAYSRCIAQLYGRMTIEKIQSIHYIRLIA